VEAFQSPQTKSRHLQVRQVRIEQILDSRMGPLLMMAARSLDWWQQLPQQAGTCCPRGQGAYQGKGERPKARQNLMGYWLLRLVIGIELAFQLG